MEVFCRRCGKAHEVDPFFKGVWREIDSYLRARDHGHLDKADCLAIEQEIDRILCVQVLQLASKEAECLDKRPYPTKEAADQAAQDAQERLGEKIQSYKCSWCDYYHIGHASKKKAKSKDVKWWERVNITNNKPVRRDKK